MTKEVQDLKNQIKTLESKNKAEVAKLVAEREDLIKQMTKIEHKETQYKHEIKNRELQVSKLNEQLKAKLFEKGGKENAKPNGAQTKDGFNAMGKILPSNEVVFSKMSAESDMHLMISKS